MTSLQPRSESTTPPEQITGSHEISVLRLDEGLPLPSYALAGDAGVDLMATQSVTIGPGQRTIVGTGLALALPEGLAGFVHPRSGLAAKHGLTVVNTPGTIDSGYRGEIKVILLNTDAEHEIHLERGDRIAQLVIQPVIRAQFVEVTDLPASQRAAQGFGSTGGF